MTQVPALTTVTAKQVRKTVMNRRPYMVGAAIWIGATALALFHGTREFFQPMQQNHFELPSQLQFRPQTTSWSPFGQPVQPSFSWPGAEPARQTFTASSAGAVAAVIMAMTFVANALSPIAADAGMAIGDDTNITNSHFSLLTAVGATSTTKALATKAVPTKVVATKAVAQQQPQRDVTREQISILSTFGTSTTQEEMTRAEFEGTDLSGVFDEGFGDDQSAYTDYCQTDGVC